MTGTIAATERPTAHVEIEYLGDGRYSVLISYPDGEMEERLIDDDDDSLIDASETAWDAPGYLGCVYDAQEEIEQELEGGAWDDELCGRTWDFYVPAEERRV